MLRKTVILAVLLLVALAPGAYPQKSTDFTGKVTLANTQVANGKFEIVLRLAEYPENVFYISLEDAPKFGLASDQEIRSGGEFGQLIANLDALKGRKVKLSCVKKEEAGSPGYRVKALQRLNGK